MFKKLKQYMEKLTAPDVTPAEMAERCGDPLAGQVEWKQLSQSSSSFCTHRLVIDPGGSCRFKPTVSVMLFAGIFVVFGLGAIPAAVVGIRGLITGTAQWAHLLMVVFFLVFGAVGLAIWHFMSVPRVFDPNQGYFWKCHRGPRGVLPAELESHPEKYVPLDDIHAIQLLRGVHSSGGSRRSAGHSYYCYELNLILHDGRRVAVVSHGKRKQILQDAAQLGEFLNVPVWQGWD